MKKVLLGCVLLGVVFSVCVLGVSATSGDGQEDWGPYDGWILRDTGSFYQTGSSAQGMDLLSFQAINGEHRRLEYFFWQMDFRGKAYTVFSIEDPFSEENPDGNLPDYIDASLIRSIVAVAARLDPHEIGRLTGLSVTNNEYIASVQVAIWKSVIETSQIYKLSPTSVMNGTIRALSDWFLATAEEHLLRKPTNMSVVRYYFPLTDLSVNTSQAVGTVEDRFNFYGPYRLVSVNTATPVKVTNLDQNFAIVNNVGGALLSEISINAPFWVRFDRTYTQNIEVQFVMENTNAPRSIIYENHIVLVDWFENIPASLVVGSGVTAGYISFTKTDSITGNGIEGVVVEIRDSSNRLVTTMATDQDGNATSPPLALGEYTVVEFSTVIGYALDDSIHRAHLLGAGQAVRLTSRGILNVAVVTFLLQNSNTSGPVGGSIFDIVNSLGEVVTRIGFNQTGRCANIRLDPGMYTLREIVTDPNYELLLHVPAFEAEVGEISEIVILKTPAFSRTLISVVDSNNIPVGNSALEFYSAEGLLLTQLNTDANGLLVVSLPIGTYYIKQAGTGGFYSGRTFQFEVDATANDTVVEIGVASFGSRIGGIVHDTSYNPVAGVYLVALSDSGEELSITRTNFEGAFMLDNIPRGDVISVVVYEAPYGFSGSTSNNRVIMNSDIVASNLMIYTLDEVNSSRSPEDQLLQWNFYNLISVDIEETVLPEGGLALLLGGIEVPDIVPEDEPSEGFQLPPFEFPETATPGDVDGGGGGISPIVIILLVVVAIVVVVVVIRKKTSAEVQEE